MRLLNYGVVSCLLALALVPAARAANITDVTINGSGTWSTDGLWSIIGVTDIGSDSNAFLNIAPDYTTLNIASGTYLGFMGFTSNWDGAALGSVITLTLNYDDSSSKSATFSFDSLVNGLEHWFRLSGDNIFLGSSGITAVDRVCNGVGCLSPNTENDAVLEFSDTAAFGTAGPNLTDTGTPEPGSALLIGLGLTPFLIKRLRRFRVS
jgi:hypothetical protein